MNTTIVVQNLKCGGCANTITTKISTLENVSNVMVDVATSSVSFDTNSEEDIATVKNKLTAIGYPAEGENNNVISKAKSFVSCATGKMSN
ncbi:MAG: heavy-metal-associated domain-containing protein [Flavobacteriaceae bacterium]|nr:heavy-metal-associated domain-containing protein [Flavobacteriaceae bacterium]